MLEGPPQCSPWNPLQAPWSLQAHRLGLTPAEWITPRPHQKDAELRFLQVVQLLRTQQQGCISLGTAA